MGLGRDFGGEVRMRGDAVDNFLKSCFPLLLFNGSFQMEINKNRFATMSIGRLETNYQV
jgi:hypothetical protein